MTCVVVGSGAAGMSAALLLAHRGHTVTLVEKCAHVAPLLAGFTRAGLHFDTGFHYGGGLHEGGIFRAWLKVLGIESQLTFRSLKPQCAELFRFAREGDYCLPTGHKAVTAAIEQYFPGHSTAAHTLLAAMDAVLNNSPYTNPGHTATTPHLHPSTGKSVADMLGPLHLPPALQSILGARCLLYGVPPHEAAWEDFAMVAAPYTTSAHSIDGGGKALAAAFVQALHKAGVRIRTGAAVTQITMDAQKHIRGVVLEDGTCLPCTLCCFTGHPAQLQHILPAGAVRPAYFSRINDMQESVPALLLFAESRSNFLDDRVCYLLGEAGLQSLFADVHSSPMPSVYLSSGLPDAQGRRGITAIASIPPLSDQHRHTANVQPRSEGYLRWKGDISRKLATYIQQRCPELRDDFRILDTSTPSSLQYWVHGSQGGLYGLQHSLRYIPLMPVTRMPGFFLAGQNIVLPGVLGAIISAALAVGFATEHAPILEVFRQCARNE